MQKLIWLPSVPEHYPYTVRHLRRLVGERRIRSFKVGAKVFLAKEDLDALPQERPALRPVGGRS